MNKTYRYTCNHLFNTVKALETLALSLMSSMPIKTINVWCLNQSCLCRSLFQFNFQNG